MLATLLPSRRTDLVIRPFGDQGRYVVKDPSCGAYFELGAEEHFLLTELDGYKDAQAICQAYVERFGQPLAEEELDAFVEMAQSQGFLQGNEAGDRVARSEHGCEERDEAAATLPRPSNSQGVPPKQSLLYWRKNFFDPDRLFTWLEPKLRCFWTRGFLIFSAGCILLAAALVWFNGAHVASSFGHALRWETVVWTWLTLLVVTALHESAHGLTCKHYGGEVHEIGFLLMYFMPCFYCNVSDAWLFKEKSKRLWVTFAGGYFELFVWALAVFVWRLTLPGSLPNYLAFIVLTACGIQTLFNFNPLLKLDGYYLLSDWVEIPNLQQRSLACFKGHVRWLFWGAARPGLEPRGRFLLLFGTVTWLYTLAFLALMLWGLLAVLGTGSWLSIGLIVLLGFVSLRSLFQGFAAGEVGNMMTTRLLRTAMWLTILGVVAAALCFVRIEDRASGAFQVRAALRAEVRAPVAGFLQVIYPDEGDRISTGAIVARLEIPDLTSRLTQKRAEVREGQAKLRLLEIGARTEEVTELRQRALRAKAWRELAQHDLRRSENVLEADLARIDEQIAACRAELDAAQASFDRSRSLLARKAIAEQEYVDAEKKCLACRARYDQARAEKRARQAHGVLEAEAELARREKESADAQGTLTLVEAGARPEQIEAARALVDRLREETRYLEGLQDKVQVCSPVPGLITTPRLREKTGQYVREGDLICLVEELSNLEVEVVVAEQDVGRMETGQEVSLKARALPLTTLVAHVDRIAPAADRGEIQSTVTIYCRLPETTTVLRPGMTGYARINTGRRPIGAIALDRMLRYLRTEFWW